MSARTGGWLGVGGYEGLVEHFQIGSKLDIDRRRIRI
jgi:hypothetical protein